jgi:hypothetical protein
VNCNAHNLQILKGLPADLGQQPRWLRGVDLNHRPLGYEANKTSIINNLQDAGGP